MLIDWFTVAAQALNFAILVWLMKRFLYKPILDAIDKREQGIAAALADADAKQAEAHKERDEFERKNNDLDQQRSALMAQAGSEADAERKRLLDVARQAADALSAQRQEALVADAQRLNQELVRRTQQEVFSIARKALADLASVSLEERAAEVFVARLRALDGAAKESLGKALATASGPVLVRSAFELPVAPRQSIAAAVEAVFSSKPAIRFETAPDLVGGIELSTNGQKLAWSISDYLASLQVELDAVLKPPTTPATVKP